MSKQARVGLFVLLAILAVFAVFFVLADLGTRTRGYKIGVRFRNSSGLRTTSVVYLSGVPIGAVDRIRLLRDYSTEVLLAIDPGFDIPVGSHFAIQAPLTGEPTVTIEPPRDVSSSSATMQHEVLDLAAQPRGSDPVSIADLLTQGQGEIRRVDDVLAQFQKAEPALLADAKATVDNANMLTQSANRSLGTVTAQVQQLTASLKESLSLASTNVVDLTGNLDGLVKRDSGQVDSLLAQLNRTSRSFGETMDSLHGVATNPQLKANLLDTTRDFALTARTFAEISGDLRKVTGNGQTQAQLRDTVAQLDATTQKVDSLVGSIGGTSNVYGVDAGASPAAASSASPASTPATSGGGTGPPQLSQVPTATSETAGAPAHAATASSNAAIAGLRARLNRFTADLVQLQIRAGYLAPLRPGSYERNTTPLLTADRGPQSDFNLLVLPHGSTGLKLGVNDIGSQNTTTANAVLLKRNSHFTYGGGIEYSRLGGETSIVGRLLGFEARVYDLRHPTLDTYINVFALPKAQIFAGERDVGHAQRRTAAGLQFEF